MAKKYLIKENKNWVSNSCSKFKKKKPLKVPLGFIIRRIF